MSLRHLTVRTYSHGYCASNLSPRGKWLCSVFAKRFAQYGFVQKYGQYQKVNLKVFAAATEDRGEFRFHINTLTQFKEFLIVNQVDGLLVKWEEAPVHTPQTVEFRIREGWMPRDFQIPIIEYLSKPLPISRFLDLQTGRGKGFSAMSALSRIGQRVVVIVKPMYIEKWAKELMQILELVPEDIIVVQGSSQLMALMMLAKEGKVHAKVIIVSNKTYQNYIKLYEKYRAEILDMGYACAPQDFFELLKAGVRLIDEVHQDFHLNMKLDLYSHVPGSIALSATLLSNDAFMEKMYELVYPIKDRFAGLALNKYIDSYAVHYRFHNPASIRTAEYGGRGYSHGAFEKSVMRNRITLNNYLSLIQHVMDVSFMKCERVPKKLLVFAASIALCTELRQHFERRYPELRVKRYVEDDPYENLFESDIVFTTLLSAGTAHDIPNLTTVILTQAVDSIQANVQSLGRLRELDDSPTQFWYFVCNDIPEHMKYHSRKMDMLAKRAKSFRDVFTGIVV